MDVGLDSDQRQLRDSARSILAAECPPSLTRHAYADAGAWRGLWKTLVGLGWTAVGGNDADDRGDALDLVVLMEQAGVACLPAPFLSTVGLAAGALRAASEPAAAVLGEIAAGAVATLLAEPPGAALPGPCLSWSSGRLTGRVAHVRDGERADLFVALASDDNGVDHLAVIRTSGLLGLDPAEPIDPSQPIAAVQVDGEPEFCVAVPREAALAVPLVAAAAELVGVADRALAMSVEHAKTREQFGQPIGAFQAVKHRLADVYVSLERARSLTYLAATLCTPDGLGEEATWRSALLAKAAAGEAATGAAKAAVAVHGAIAQTWEHDAHVLLRRAWQSSALLGDSASLYVAAGRSYVKADAR